ncbi:hypothetical protein [Halomonas tibetensis]|uniref:Uncharacterized protein n=1 Tax=Halomonas tibetensis TaxID=2259590 RepID=A0ABV7B6A3_9GAMM
MPTPSELSALMFHADPMGTCCRENDAFDEYDRIAFELAERLEEGEISDVALHAVLSEWFDDDLVERADLAGVIEALESVSTRTGESP